MSREEMNHSKKINTCEQSILYNVTNQILLNIENWYLMKETYSVDYGRSFGYHRGCSMRLRAAPFLHYRQLKCRGCGELPPDGIAGAYTLHNMEYIQQSNGEDDAD